MNTEAVDGSAEVALNELATELDHCSIVLRLGEPGGAGAHVMDLELRISPDNRLAVTGASSGDQATRSVLLAEMLDQLEAALRADAAGRLESLGAERAQAEEAAGRRIREMRLLLGLVR